MQMKDSIYDMLHENFSTTLFLLVEIPDCIIQGFCKEKIIHILGNIYDHPYLLCRHTYTQKSL